ncbi:DUF1127 domain-containing protein [Halopseudomonas sp.]|uniref:DUF1127 domain-containing protein n=1 Tax=Halopseudomonas sp. TaxID=2901191 RepID=UPI00300328B1
MKALACSVVRSRQGGWRWLVNVIARSWLLLRRWHRVSYERRLLASLSSHQLSDIGVSRAEALSEAARPFWDLPD